MGLDMDIGIETKKKKNKLHIQKLGQNSLILLKIILLKIFANFKVFNIYLFIKIYSCNFLLV